MIGGSWRFENNALDEKHFTHALALDTYTALSHNFESLNFAVPAVILGFVK